MLVLSPTSALLALERFWSRRSRWWMPTAATALQHRLLLCLMRRVVRRSKEAPTLTLEVATYATVSFGL
eukprot:13849382-Alexandrium_andersonii.AAC.1